MSVTVRKLYAWVDFESEIKKMSEDYSAKKNNKSLSSASPWLFRGQSNSSWKLETSLERYLPENKNFRVDQYFQRLRTAKSRVETFTARPWQLPSVKHFLDQMKKDEQMTPLSGSLETVQFMVYLRHHSFPSPLLDWTSSPYVAAFFAYRHADVNVDQEVAIYAYMEDVGHGKVWGRGEPVVHTIGPNLTADKRHYLQQCHYSFCYAESEKSEFAFSSHETAFSNNQENQDVVYKYTLPVSEKREVLMKLDMHNLNSYSLFGSEESLMETVAFREFYMR